MRYAMVIRASRRLRPAVAALALGLTAAAGTGCGSTESTIAASVVGGSVAATLLGGYSPSHQIEQVYYLGVFDPREQIPSSVYRVRVRGQASLISNTKFGSGWVPAQLVDSLATTGRFDADRPTFGENDREDLAELTTGRRLMVFGPEGFREAPRDHRLVVVMGANPEAFFEAIDQVLGVVGEVQQEARDSEFSKLLFKEMARVQSERARLADFEATLRLTEAEAR